MHHEALSRKQFLRHSTGLLAVGTAAAATSPGAAEGPRESDVIVVGAGLAGLTAARELTRRGLSVRVIEARDRVGGRTWARATRDGEMLDVGGQWIGPTQDRILALVEEFKLQTYPQFATGTKLLRARGEWSRYEGAIPSLSPFGKFDLARMFRRLNRYAQTVPLDAPYNAPRALEWDAMTLETWKRGFLKTPKAEALLDIVARSVFGAEPADLSFLFFLFYLHSGGDLDRLTRVSDGAQAARVHGGTQQISERLAAGLGEGVCLNSPVRAVRHSVNRVSVISDNGEWRGRHVVMAVPPALAGRIVFDPPLPPLRAQLLQRLPMGSIIKCIVVYPKPFWRDEGLSGEIASDDGPLCVAFDDTPDGSPPRRAGALVGFIAGREARAWAERSATERRDAIIRQLSQCFGDKAGTLTEYIEGNWMAEEWSGGCYEAYMPPGVMTEYGKLLRERIGNIHWAGTETSEIWCGYMDGAVRSGERVAAEILGEI